ncbi:MAG: 3'-5' exonuclease [Bacilli bacterium]|nr:3'-5' exonuclease [Bacilli bacterium]MDD4608148.1 3'-5' exonuclease [Bacilli bacterium]
MNLETLNNKQLEAVKVLDGPLLILAGAGSGKTRVLTTRVAYLIEQGVNPEQILAITFTNKAAKEMKDRIIKMLGPVAYQIQISTFHSFGLKIIKYHHDLLGYKKNFTILDSEDSITVIKKILKGMDLDPKIYHPKAIKSQISGAKNELLNPEEYSKFANTEYEKIVLKVYKAYQNKLVINNSLDFDDLLMLPIVLFNQNKDVLKIYQEQFKYVLIDEYQDTNEAQYVLTKMISAKYKNICVVGDPDQSIYAFRGSNYRNILNFEKDYKNAKTIMLEENYRSTKNILNVANSVIKNNGSRKEKNLWTDNEDGDKIIYHRSENEKDEAFYVMSQIKKIMNQSPLSEIAILYRTNAQSRNMEEALLRENIPYKVIGSFYFYKRKEIKDLISYLKLIYNQDDDISLTRIINVPKRGIGLKSIENLVQKANDEGKSMYEAIDNGKELAFRQIIEELIKMQDSCSLTELVDLILEKTGIRNELIAENTLDAEVRLENLEEFKSITKNFEEKNGIISLEEFLNEISLVSDIEEHKNNNEVVTLMTVHSAKGLEFNNVFVIGMEDGIFPHANAFQDPSQLEEERRLCYVAITRARKKLWLVNAKRRMLYGMENANVESRFIKEIDGQYLDKDIVAEETRIIKTNMIDASIDYSISDKVVHNKYGVGVIVNIEKSILTIAFNHPHGIKMIIKGHKSIRKV